MDRVKEQHDAGDIEEPEATENNVSMDVDNDDTMGFIGSLEPSAEDCIGEILGSYGQTTDKKREHHVHAPCRRCP